MWIVVLDNLLARTLRSVKFGIFMLVLVAVYIAIGSGFPRVREYFETDELAFFNAWPFKLIIVLLIVTLTTVTFLRIPFTPPRYGVWMVHVGIVLLIFSIMFHYASKQEGTVFLRINDARESYYDRWERSLYARLDGVPWRAALPSLPRFEPYDQTLGNGDYLNLPDLNTVRPVSLGLSTKSFAEQIGVPDLQLKVVGYWPYADVIEELVPQSTAGSGSTGFTLLLPDDRTRAGRPNVLLGDKPRYQRFAWRGVQFEHRIAKDPAAIAKVVEASERMHQLDVSIGTFRQTLFVEPGRDYKLGETGYGLRIESFQPDWITIDKKVTPLLTMIVVTPEKVFRRQVLVGVDQPTDWLLNVPDAAPPAAGPMGQRQKVPLDPQLKITYTYADPARLLPEQMPARYIIYTTESGESGDSPTTTGSTQTDKRSASGQDKFAIVVGVSRTGPHTVQTLVGSGTIAVNEPESPEEVLVHNHQHDDQHAPVTVKVDRVENVVVQRSVREVPKEQRNSTDGREGIRQVLRVRATATLADGQPWSDDVFVPTSQFPMEMSWTGGVLEVPGATRVAQLQLGNSTRPLPARIRLDGLSADTYAGVELASATAIRDYQSQLTLTDRDTGTITKATVFLNNPVFVQNGRWIFFQVGYDTREQSWTILGIGSRPGVWGMAGGCILIIVGIFYAFYIKPVLIRARKRRALMAAGLDPDYAQPAPAKTNSGRPAARGNRVSERAGVKQPTTDVEVASATQATDRTLIDVTSTEKS